MGLGWTGSILAQELTDAGLNVVAIERGPWRDTATDFNIGYMPDELRYAIRKDLFLQPSSEAMTMRNAMAQTALPMRDYGSLPAGQRAWAAPACTGTATPGAIWASRFRDQEPPDPALWRQQDRRTCRLQDWGVTWDEIEPIASTSSNISAASPARPASSRARSSRAAIRLKARAAANIPIRR